MECKICHNVINEGDVRCSYCGAKVVKSNYGNNRVSENNINTSNSNQIINNSQVGVTNNISSQDNIVNNNQVPNIVSKMETEQAAINRPIAATNLQSTTEKINNNNQIDESNSTIRNNDQNSNNIIVNSNMEEDLAEHYLGEKYQVFKKKKFSFATFFLGGFYMCYRKQYINAIVLFAVSLASSLIASLMENVFIFLLSLVVYIYYSIRFPKMYLEVVNKKVQADIKQFSGKNYEELRKKLLRESSTSSGAVVIAFVIFIVIGLVISIGTFVKGIGSVLSDIEVGKDSTEDISENNNKNEIGNYKHGYLKVKSSWHKENSSTNDKLVYTSSDGNSEIEFRISDSTNIDEVVKTEQELLGGRTISVVQKNGWLISNSNNNINKEILVGEMEDGKIHIITISNTSNNYSVFDILDTYYI